MHTLKLYDMGKGIEPHFLYTPDLYCQASSCVNTVSVHDQKARNSPARGQHHSRKPIVVSFVVISSSRAKPTQCQKQEMNAGLLQIC